VLARKYGGSAVGMLLLHYGILRKNLYCIRMLLKFYAGNQLLKWCSKKVSITLWYFEEKPILHKNAFEILCS
jgi:hypothetical protein